MVAHDARGGAIHTVVSMRRGARALAAEMAFATAACGSGEPSRPAAVSSEDALYGCDDRPPYFEADDLKGPPTAAEGDVEAVGDRRLVDGGTLPPREPKAIE